MRIPLPRLWGALILLAASGATGETLSQAVDRYARPDIAPPARRVANARVTAGHIEITLKSGVLAAVRAGSAEAGFFFRGKGSWRYTSECEEELAALRHSAAEASRWKPRASGRAVVLEDDFHELLWMGRDRPSEAGREGADSTGVREEDARSLADALARHEEEFSRLRILTLPQRAVLASRTGVPEAVSWGEFTGGRNDALYVHDPLVRRAESLAVVEKTQFDSANAAPELTLRPVSHQPLGGTVRRPPAEPVTLTRVEADIEADGEHGRIVTRETFVPAGEPLRFLRLNLRSRVFADSSLDIRPENLLRVVDASGRELSFDHRNGQLLVELPEAQAAGQPFTLRFEIEGNFLYRPRQDSLWMLGLEEWFPQPDFEACAFTWKCRVKVRKPFVPIASGMVRRRAEDGDWNVLETELDRPISLPVVLAGDYHLEEIELGGRKFHIASYAYRNARAGRELADLAARIIAFDEEFLGPFPWPELTIVELNGYGLGVAPPATMFITQEAFSPHRDDLTKRFARGLRERFAHEIAHQYWGHQVTWAGAYEEWISESFAEYCAALFLRRDKGERDFHLLVRQWEGEAREAGDHATLATANQILGEHAFRDRVDLLYGKGPWLLESLAREIGEEKFRGFLGGLQSSLGWQFATTEEIEGRLEQETGRSFKDFFDRYYWGTGIPAAPN